MQAGDVKLGSIFFDNHRYVIPTFQRPYVWSQERNWVPLWEDIAAAADSVIHDMEHDSWPDEPPTYFLGSIVVKATQSHPQRLGGSMLVDGQQRLTTLQVLLAAARFVSAELGAESAAGRFDDWVENSAKTVHEKWPDDRYKLWPLPQDRPQYLWAVRPPNDTTACPDADHPISEARVWFEATIREWAMQGEVPSDRLDALHSALETRIALVRITLEKTDNAQIIFEALNHRGVELSQSDLIKNLLFRLAEDQVGGKVSEQLLVDHWLPLDGRSWRKEVVTGRIRRSLLDQVIAYWLTIRVGHTVSVEGLFDDFKPWVLQNALDAETLIKEIRKYADLYDELVGNPSDEATASLVDMVIATKTNTAWPLILGIYGDSRINGEQRRVAARALLSYLTRRMICGLTSKDYNNIFAMTLKAALDRAGVDGLAGDTVEFRLARLSGETRSWPDDGEFTAALAGSNFYGMTQSRQRVFFAGVENYLRDSHAEEVTPIRAQWEYLNLEHVMPQSWQTNWPLLFVPSDDPEQHEARVAEATARREMVLNSVGNLTLTNGRLNSKMRNSSWSDKKELLHNKSTFLITTASILVPYSSGDVAIYGTNEWNEERIAERTAYLADLAPKVWPRPSGVTVEQETEDELHDDGEGPDGDDEE